MTSTNQQQPETKQPIENKLYNLLFAGKISIKEYLDAVHTTKGGHKKGA